MKKAVLLAAWLVALAGAVSPAFAQGVDPRWVTTRNVSNVTIATTTTNLFLLGTANGSAIRIVTCTSAMGGYLFLDNTTNIATQAVACLSNGPLQANYQLNNIGAIPIAGKTEAIAAGERKNVIIFSPNSQFGLWQGRIFCVATNNNQTNFNINLIDLKP